MAHAGISLINPQVVFEKISLGQGMRVADLGCGSTGHFVFPAARTVGERGAVYAVDVIKEVLQNIRSRIKSEGYDNVYTVWSDIEREGKASIPSDSLDACFIVNVLFMVQDRLAVCREARRLLKPGGWLAIIEWARLLGMASPAPQALVGSDEVVVLGEQCSLEQVEQFPLGDYHYCILFKKPI